MRLDRDIPADETNWPCHAGQGECKKPATKIRDNGDGGEAYYCDQHAKEFDWLDQWLEEHPEMCEPFRLAIEKVE